MHTASTRSTSRDDIISELQRARVRSLWIKEQMRQRSSVL